MSIATAIQNAQQKVANAYTAVSNKGGTLPDTQNLSNLPAAINSITSGGNNQTKTFTASATSATVSTVTPDSGYDGLSSVTVDLSYIEDTLSTINGNGSGSGAIVPTGTISISKNGNYDVTNYASAEVNVSASGGSYGVIFDDFTVEQHVLKAVGTRHVTLPDNIGDLGNNVFQGQNGSAFFGGTITADFSSLIGISGSYAMQNAFYMDIYFQSIDLSNIESITGREALSRAFMGCTSLLSFNLPKLKTLSTQNYILYRAFRGCTSLSSVDFTSLETISGQYIMLETFYNCTSLTTLSFPALKTVSNTNNFNNMLSNVTGCTVHFRADVEDTIGAFASVQNGFGGTNTVVLFDL